MPTWHQKLHINTNTGLSFCGMPITEVLTVANPDIAHKKTEELCLRCLAKYNKLRDKKKVIRRAAPIGPRGSHAKSY